MASGSHRPLQDVLLLASIIQDLGQLAQLMEHAFSDVLVFRAFPK